MIVQRVVFAIDSLERSDPAVAATRILYVRNLVALAALALRGEGPMADVKALQRELSALDIPWRARDARAAVMALATRALLAVR